MNNYRIVYYEDIIAEFYITKNKPHFITQKIDEILKRLADS